MAEVNATPPVEAPAVEEPTPATPVTPPTVSEVELIQAFVDCSGGAEPYPRTREAFAALSATAQAQVRANVPALFERYSADPSRLPAAVELKLSAGNLAALSEGDVEALERAGYVDTAHQLRTQRRAALVQQWQAGRAARAAEREALAQADAEQRNAQQAALVQEQELRRRARFQGRG